MKNTDVSVYEILRDKIINLDFKPGQELNINSLAQKMGISRSPIRDALLHLELDNLVEIFPQKGTRVSFLDKKIIKQERFMRTTLELGVLKIFMENLKDDAKRKIAATKLQAILLEQNASFLDGNKKAFLQKDNALHHFFYSESGNEWLWNVLVSHTGNDYRVRILSYNAEKIADNVEKEHRQLVEAIREGDAEKARKIDEEHLQKISEVLEDLEASYPEYFSKET